MKKRKYSFRLFLSVIFILLCISPATGFAGENDSSLSFLFGKKIATKLGSTVPSVFDPLLEGEEFIYCQDLNAQLEMLKAKKVSALICDEPIANYMCVINPAFVTLPAQMKNPVGFALRKGSPLTSRFNEVLNEMIAEGRIEYFKKKWYVADTSGLEREKVEIPNPKGNLVYATDPSLVPVTFADKDGKPVGFELDIV